MLKWTAYGVLAALISKSILCTSYFITSARTYGNRLQVTTSIRNCKDIQVINKEPLENKGYLVDIYHSHSWLFNNITYVTIIDAQSDPTYTTDFAARKLRNAINDSHFNLTFISKNNEHKSLPDDYLLYLTQ